MYIYSTEEIQHRWNKGKNPLCVIGRISRHKISKDDLSFLEHSP